MFSFKDLEKICEYCKIPKDKASFGAYSLTNNTVVMYCDVKEGNVYKHVCSCFVDSITRKNEIQIHMYNSEPNVVNLIDILKE